MIITLENEYLICEISSFGGEILSIKDRSGIEYIWQGNAEYWVGHAPNYFPFQIKLERNIYTYMDEHYTLETHGFLKDMRMKVDSLTGESLVLSVSDTKESRKSYPFHFTLRLEFRLTGRTLTVKYVVVNLNNDSMYFAIAGNPGFNVPLEEGARFEDYRLRFFAGSEPRRIATFETGLLRGSSDEEFELDEDSCVELSHNLFSDGAVLLADSGGGITVESNDHDRSFVVSFLNMPYVCLWQKPDSEAPFICIEPWTSLPPIAGLEPDLENMGLISLRSGEDYTTSYSISCL
ncbi:MAG: aldose 1-epimerase family protein [Lachnospiraceae bacterium]|nr:aldose 1-epimerase family protein [Lachnospiraceae bacterium]